MVYKRKSEQHKWIANNMQQAIEAVRAKEMGLKRASHQFGVPRSTLQRRCRKDASADKSAVKTLGRFRVAFTPLMQMELFETRERHGGCAIWVYCSTVAKNSLRIRRAKQHRTSVQS